MARMKPPSKSPPVIGLTPDIEPRLDMEAETVYVLRRNYVNAIHAAGGVPIILPYEPSLARTYVEKIDGLVVTGGLFDIDPRRYGAQCRGSVNTKEDRTNFEMALMEAALEANIPILGICNGMQLLAITLGGSLTQNIPTDIPSALEHMPNISASIAHHWIDLVPGTMLFNHAPKDRVRVNSVHHQSVNEGSAYVVAARAPDGVIEAIEVPGRNFCMGLQWHPEYCSSVVDASIFNLFVISAAAGCHGMGTRKQ